jgi:YfiR/HmsC-like
MLLACGATASAQDQGTDTSEYLIEAGYIYNFAKLVEWPASAAAQKAPEIVIGVLGNDAFASVLQRVVDGKKIDNRPFLVKRLKSREFKDCGCHILFVSAAESARSDDIVQFQSSSSVLTISESPDFARRGGIVAFVLQDSKVRFAVNVDAAAQASLTISSRLLALATIVHSTR